MTPPGMIGGRRNRDRLRKRMNRGMIEVWRQKKTAEKCRGVRSFLGLTRGAGLGLGDLLPPSASPTCFVGPESLTRPTLLLQKCASFSAFQTIIH